MAAKLNPYLNFRGNAREAMEFYRSVFGGELTTTTFGEFQLSQDPGDQDKIMHGLLVTDSGLTLMGADIPAHMQDQAAGGFSGFSVSLSGPNEDEAELRGYWQKLSDGGNVTVPLEKAPWGDEFGMCTDRFGVDWMVNIAGATS